MSSTTTDIELACERGEQWALWVQTIPSLTLARFDDGRKEIFARMFGVESRCQHAMLYKSVL